MSAFDDLLKASGNEYASVVADGNDSDVSGYIDTGSYSLNALISGSIYGGIPANRVTAFAGEESTGKTFYALNVAASFLKKNPKGKVAYFESEHGLETDMLTARGIDLSRFGRLPVSTIQEFRTQVVKILDAHMEVAEKKRDPLVMVLDSLGGLSTTKEIEDITKGSETKDMTRAGLVRGAFRVITLKMGRANVPMIVINHVYDVVGSYIPTKKMGGGAGLSYAASSIIFLNKSKKTDKEDGVTGAIITATTNKSRLTKENKRVQTLLDHSTGLNQYYGLLDLAAEYGLVKKLATQYEFSDGVKAFEKHIYANPEKYFTPELLTKIEEIAAKEFKYGSALPKEEEESETEE